MSRYIDILQVLNTEFCRFANLYKNIRRSGLHETQKDTHTYSKQVAAFTEILPLSTRVVGVFFLHKFYDCWYTALLLNNNTIEEVDIQPVKLEEGREFLNIKTVIKRQYKVE